MVFYDYIIVGSGLYGSVMAERLKSAGKTVLVIEKRNHIGGNCFSFKYDGTDISVHKYGTHIFHTNSKTIWEYINRFGEFNRYQHRVLTTHKNKVYAMPINLGTINSFFGLNLKPFEVAAFIARQTKNSGFAHNLEEKAVSLIGNDLYEAFIKGYTQKQWGCDPKELPADIFTRLPVRTSYYDSYFDDVFQGLPINGFTSLFDNMLQGVPVEMNVDFFADRSYWRSKCNKLIYSGPLDRFFDYEFGRLSWRSVRFEYEYVEHIDYQGTSVMNYADMEIPYTRVHEPKHLHPEKTYVNGTNVIIREYPVLDETEPYYPVNFAVDKDKLTKYEAIKSRETGVVFGGRLAEYKYYDIHHVIEKALKDVESLFR